MTIFLSRNAVFISRHEVAQLPPRPSPLSKSNESTSLKLILTSLPVLASKGAEDVAAGDDVIKLLRSRATLLQDLNKTSKLLGGILAILAQLVGNLDVVLSVLVLQTLGGLLDLGSKFLEFLRGRVLGNKVVQHLDGASLAVQTTTNGAAGASLAVQEVDKGLLGAGAGVGLGLGGALGEELDRRVTGDTLLLGQSLSILGLGVDLGNHDVVLEGEVVGEGLPDGSEGLAVCDWEFG